MLLVIYRTFELNTRQHLIDQRELGIERVLEVLPVAVSQTGHKNRHATHNQSQPHGIGTDLRKAKHTQIGYDTHGEYQHDLGRYVTCQLQYDSDIHRYGTEAEVVDAKAGEYPAGQGEVDTVETKAPQEELRHSHH